jgi:hypothetical protein
MVFHGIRDARGERRPSSPIRHHRPTGGSGRSARSRIISTTRRRSSLSNLAESALLRSRPSLACGRSPLPARTLQGGAAGQFRRILGLDAAYFGWEAHGARQELAAAEEDLFRHPNDEAARRRYIDAEDRVNLYEAARPSITTIGQTPRKRRRRHASLGSGLRSRDPVGSPCPCQTIGEVAEKM